MQINRVTDVLPALAPGLLYGLDIETTTHSPWHPDFKIRLLQLATETEAWVFNMYDPEHKQYVTDFLNDDRNSFASHTDYDTLCCSIFLGTEDHLFYRNVDTRMLGTMASPEDRLGMNDLDSLSSKWLGKEFKKQSAELQDRFKWWSDQTTWPAKPTAKEIKDNGWNTLPVDDPIYVQYAGMDAIATRRLVPVLLRAAKVPVSLLRMEVWLCAQATKMRLSGMRVDPYAFKELYTFAKEKCDYHEEEFGRLVQEPYMKGRGTARKEYWKPVSPRSGRKIAQYLYEHGANFTGFPLTDAGQKAAKEGLLTHDDEMKGVYASLAGDNKDLFKKFTLDEEGQEAADHLFGFKEQVYTMTKLEEIQKVIVDDVVHPGLRTLGTVSGRMSANSPNTQNYSKKDPAMREIFVPRPGYILIGCDFAQIEVRVAAALSRDPLLIEAVTGGKSFHEVTMEALGLDKPKAKIWNFASLYGAGPKALNSQTGIPYNTCRELQPKFWETYSTLARYRNYTMEFTEDIRTISGRRIPVPYFEGKAQSYKNLNYMIQGAARELFCASWYRYVNTTCTENASVWAVIHDEMVVEVPFNELDFHLKALQDSMTFSFMGIPIEGEAQVLSDETGRSRWTTGDKGKEYQEFREKSNIKLLAAG